jgi:hypothetical protein
MAIVTKAIKPTKLNIAAFREEIVSALNETSEAMLKEFEKTTDTWKDKPTFETIKDTTGGNLAVLVATDDEIYGYVNDGTRPHDIVPIRAKVLAFPGGFSAKTSPNVIGSKPGGSFGSTVFARGVHHPGTEPRNFDSIIQKIFQPRFQRRMEKAMSNAANRCGHAI